jgi:hypothetical protein
MFVAFCGKCEPVDLGKLSGSPCGKLLGLEHHQNLLERDLHTLFEYTGSPARTQSDALVLMEGGPLGLKPI